MDEDGDYLPARDPEDPPAPEPPVQQTAKCRRLLHPIVDFST